MTEAGCRFCVFNMCNRFLSWGENHWGYLLLQAAELVVGQVPPDFLFAFSHLAANSDIVRVSTCRELPPG